MFSNAVCCDTIISIINQATTNQITKMKNRMKASELVKLLQKCLKEAGDLEISINTQDGGSYGLYSEDSVGVVEYNTKNGNAIRVIEIG